MKISPLVLGWSVWCLLVVPLSGQPSRLRPERGYAPQTVEAFRASWRVLEPITRRNLSIYPVVSTLQVDASTFLTLDEGLAKGEVRITERGRFRNSLYRRRSSRPWPPPDDSPQPDEGASVNELMLVNLSNRPLLLLAGEVVSGGKQNRIIGADAVVPPRSGTVPLSVYCVEHGRWTAGGQAFGTAGAMAHPQIRRQAQVNRSQQGVWDSVARSQAVLAAPSPTSSYVDVLNSPQARRALDGAVASIARKYEGELRARVGGTGAVGVVVAVNGELVWSDIFPSTELFGKYWPKLLRSYVLEADSRAQAFKTAPSVKAAKVFLLEDDGRVHVKEDPGAYRRTEIAAPNYQIVALEAIGRFNNSGLLVHYNKMERD